MPTYARIDSIEYALPAKLVDNEALATEFPEWSVEKIAEKTGISSRYIVDEDECASDLAVKAAETLFNSSAINKEDIDFLLLCTQSPDYFLPTTACLVQDRLGLPTSCGALDFNLGCSGFVYGLGLAKGLIETGQAKNILLITAETYSRFINKKDKSVRTLFGDGAAATLLTAYDNESPMIGPFVYGTDGRGGENLIVPHGGLRNEITPSSHIETSDQSSNFRARKDLYMNGSEVFTFTLKEVPKSLNQLLELSGKSIDDIDLFVFHQANKFMLDSLLKKTKIPKEKFFLAYQKFGNTVSSTVPIAMKEALLANRLSPGDTVLLMGFGVGYSWAGTLIRW
jgi:3-oxoacyl-[acyl-carrier-protein] synthase-3